MKESLHLEKKQGELAREQKSKEELERSRRLELLKQDTDIRTTLTDCSNDSTVEAQLEEKIDDNKIVDMDMVSDDKGETYGQQTEDIPSTYLYEHEIPPPYVEDPSIHESFYHDTTYSVFTSQNGVNTVSSSTDVNLKNQKDYLEKVMSEFSVDRVTPPHSRKLPASLCPKQEEFTANTQNVKITITSHRNTECYRTNPQLILKISKLHQ